MRLWADIKQNILEKGKIYTLFAFVLLLCGCQDECATVHDYIMAGIGPNCLLCALFGGMADTTVTVAKASWETMAKPLREVVVIVAAVYVALRTLKPVMSAGKQETADYMTNDDKGILPLLFKTMVIYALLDGWTAKGVDSEWLVRYILNPILQSGIQIGDQISSFNNAGGFNFSVKTIIHDLLDWVFGNTKPAWQETFDMIGLTIRNFNEHVYKMIALGQSMICHASHGMFWNWYYLMLLYGFIFFIFGWIMLVGIGFYIIDVAITLGIAAIVLPIGIAAAISDWTVTYTKNLWHQFLNVFFSFVILGIIVNLSLELVYHCAGMAATPDANGNTFDVQAAMDSNDAQSLSEYLWISGNLLLTILCFSIITQLVEQMKGLANKLSGGSGFDGASQVGGDLIKPQINAAKKMTSWAGSATMGRVSRSLGKSRPSMWLKSKYVSFRGRVFGVGPEGYKFWLRRR